MARGSKKSYTSKQKRKAEHIEDSYEKRGVKKKEAEERAWRTVNKQDHGGKKKRSGSKAKSGSKTKSSSSTKKKASSRKSAPKKRSSSKKK